VYSLGVVLYELLAGRPPFMGDTPVAVASKHVRDVVPSPRQFNPSLPADLESITLLALAKNPADRYQTADELRADLLRFTEGQPVSASGKRAIMGEDVTTAVAAVAGGAATAVALAPERTTTVPLMPGPRTDIRRKRDWTPWIVAGIVLALLLAGGIVYAATSSSGVTRMPPLQGSSLASAYTTLQNDGLKVGAVTRVGSTTIAKGLVISTIPISGALVRSGQSVVLTVSAGAPPVVTIPNVVGLSLSSATLQLQTLGLIPKLEFTDQGTPNVVITQSPGPGQGHKGDTIILIILNPTSPVPVPSVAGDTISAASAAIGAAGFTVSAVQINKCSNTVASGQVIGTSPNAPTTLQAGSSVGLIVSTGVCNVIVPTVVNDSQAAATSALSAQGLVPNFVNGDNGSCHGLSDVVIGQDIQGGTQAPYGSTVNLTYCPPGGQGH
jgi:serine/threonine-protein kinase